MAQDVLSKRKNTLDIELLGVCLVAPHLRQGQVLSQPRQMVVVGSLVDRLLKQKGFFEAVTDPTVLCFDH